MTLNHNANGKRRCPQATARRIHNVEQGKGKTKGLLKSHSTAEYFIFIKTKRERGIERERERERQA